MTAGFFIFLAVRGFTGSRLMEAGLDLQGSSRVGVQSQVRAAGLAGVCGCRQARICILLPLAHSVRAGVPAPGGVPTSPL